jgi:DNA-binding MarR family transcriptional regulator
LATPLEEVESLDRLVHEPARLVILTALAACASADFVFLQRVTGLTNGNLSAHLTKLYEAGLVEIHKRFVDRKPNTNVSITVRGRHAVECHWAKLEQLRASARGLKPQTGKIRSTPA